jgi:hypothetical protein
MEATTMEERKGGPLAGVPLVLEVRACGRGCWIAALAEERVGLCGVHARRMTHDRSHGVVVKGVARVAPPVRAERS